VSIGRNVHIGHGSLLRGAGGIRIGDNTHISRDCIIYSENHNYHGERLPYDDSLRRKEVVIGKNVWVGIRVTILPGAQIGDGVIVGAGSTVLGVVPDLAIVGDGPAQIIGHRDELHYKELDQLQRYGGKGGKEL